MFYRIFVPTREATGLHLCAQCRETPKEETREQLAENQPPQTLSFMPAGLYLSARV